MHTTHGGFSIIAFIKPGKEDEVGKILEDLNNNAGNIRFPFADSESTLFASAVVIPTQNYHGRDLKPLLMFMTSFSGPFKFHLRELLEIAEAGLIQLFQNCENFPAGPNVETHKIKIFLINASPKKHFLFRYAFYNTTGYGEGGKPQKNYKQVCGCSPAKQRFYL